MAMQTNWNLPQEIIQQSYANNWEKAVLEWHLEAIELLDPGEFDQCLCGHYPIRELCIIRNDQTNKTAIVGNQCIHKFQNDSHAKEVFGKVSLVFSASKRIMEDLTAHANSPLIEHAEQKGILSSKDAAFYMNVHRKRNLSDAQGSYLENLNRKILYELILSVRQAYHRLKYDIEGTAGPKLFKYANEKGVLKDEDEKFYSEIWHRAHHTLTARQQRYKRGLNEKILRAFQGVLDSTTPTKVARPLAN